MVPIIRLTWHILYCSSKSRRVSLVTSTAARLKYSCAWPHSWHCASQPGQGGLVFTTHLEVQSDDLDVYFQLLFIGYISIVSEADCPVHDNANSPGRVLQRNHAECLCCARPVLLTLQYARVKAANIGYLA